MIANSFVADGRQLRRWGLSETLLPPHTEVLFREPTLWQRYRREVLVTLAVIIAESLLIGLLLLERRQRKRAQSAVQEQTVYEQTMATLTTDAVRHAPEDAPRALEDALARIGRYAGANTATLVQFPDTSTEAPTQLSWMASPNSNHGQAPTEMGEQVDTTRLDIPLVADGTPIGSLHLSRSDGRGWPNALARRLDSAGEVIASAMARSRAARRIRHGEELNRAVLASLSTRIAILDGKGTIIRVNDAWRELARCAADDITGEAFVGSNYLDECRRAEERGCDGARDVREGIQDVLARRAWPFRCEYHCPPPDERWCELFVDRLQVPEGGAIVTHLDISDRRLAEGRTEEMRRQMAHMGRVALVGELAATISHELRQPLAAIRVNAEVGDLLLASTPHELGEAREIFQSIVADDTRAVEVIEGVRKLLRKEELVQTTVNLNQICRDAARLLQHDALLRNARLELSLSPEPPMVAGDPIELQQLVINLTLNGLESASLSTRERTVVVQTEALAGDVELVVRDTGAGIPPGVHPHLFESFFSTKRGGLGLGLVIVRSIVERHHGRVRGENHPSGGAVFVVRLPIAPNGSTIGSTSQAGLSTVPPGEITGATTRE
jgi:signal transduction histidine kinase